MNIHQQLKSIVYCFAALIGLILLLIASGAFGVKTLTQRQAWVDHTNYVMNQIEITEQEFSNADYAGRNQVITGMINTKLPVMRETALENINILKTLTQDNPNQFESLNLLDTAIRDSFKTQDEQFNNVVRTPDAVIYRLETTTRRARFTELIDGLFVHIKLNEINLLRDNRMPRLTMWQWRLVYFTAVVIFLLLTVAVILFIFHIRLLNRNIEALAFMEKAIYTGESEQIKVSAKDLERLHAFVRQDTSELKTTR